MKRTSIVLIGLGLILAGVFFAKNYTASTPQVATEKGAAKIPLPPPAIIIDAKDDSCRSGIPEAPSCAKACEINPISCAATILKHIQSDSFIARRVLNPGTRAQKPNIQTPMHGLFVPTWINPQLNQAIKQAVANPFANVNMPPWSISAKLNNNPGAPENSNPKRLDWATVMYKIPGYCPQRIFPLADAQCVGGEWFWFLYRFNNFPAFEYSIPNNASVPAWGKAEAFCLDCHGGVADADWLWITHDQIRRAQQLQKPVHTDGELPGAQGAGLCDNITRLTSSRPADVAVDPMSLPIAQRQRMFDCYSWLTFVALNWPADKTQRGKADSAQTIAAPGNRVWETYKQVYEVFQPRNPDWRLQSSNWNDPQPLPKVCDQALAGSGLAIDKVMAFQVLNETHQAFGNQFNTLTDQNGQITHYNVRFNRDEFEFLKKTGYANTGAYNYNGPPNVSVVFPDNQTTPGAEGVTEIKSAWKELCRGDGCKQKDNASRYYHRKALIYTPALTRAVDPRGNKQPPRMLTTPASCRVANVGLVGLHIAAKTFWAPQWIWPTFEHIDNVPGLAEDAAKQFSYYQAACTPKVTASACLKTRPGVFDKAHACCENLQNISNAKPAPGVGRPIPKPTPIMSNQIKRIDGIGESAAALNKIFRTLLAEANSPLQYYVLISTQWPGKGRLSKNDTPAFGVVNKLCLDGDTPPCFRFLPENLRLRNSVIESFQVSYCEPDDEDIGNDPVACTPKRVTQDPHLSSTGGCMNCHFSSGTDSSYIWADAIEEQVPLSP